jgi:hypothetical protein
VTAPRRRATVMTANAIAEGREGRMQHLLTEYRRMQSPEALSVKNKNQSRAVS